MNDRRSATTESQRESQPRGSLAEPNDSTQQRRALTVRSWLLLISLFCVLLMLVYTAAVAWWGIERASFYFHVVELAPLGLMVLIYWICRWRAK